MRQMHLLHLMFSRRMDVFWGCVPTVFARGRQTQHNGQHTAVFLVKPDNGMIKCEDIKPLVNPNDGQLMSLHHAQIHKLIYCGAKNKVPKHRLEANWASVVYWLWCWTGNRRVAGWNTDRRIGVCVCVCVCVCTSSRMGQKQR